MKSLLRFFLVLVTFLILAAGVVYFSITRPVFQKKLVESRLPEGSSIKFVRITSSSIELTDLKLQLADGTTVKLKSLRSGFSPLALILSDMVELRGLKIEGLVVNLPEINASTVASDNLPTNDGISVNDDVSLDDALNETPSSAAQANSSPTDAFYALSEIGLLFDIDSIDLNGLLIDSSGNRFVLAVIAGRIASGSETRLEAKLELESKQAQQGGLSEFLQQPAFDEMRSVIADQAKVELDLNVAYDPIQNPSYRVASSFVFKNVDPSLFSKSNYSKFPVQGLFEGQLKFAGSGDTLEEAGEDSEGHLKITGRNGVLTVFELDSRSQFGLTGAGMLGQRFNRPGITAMAKAVPYFKDMKFESFTLELVRGEDKQVRIPKLNLMGDSLNISGQGVIAAGNLGEFLEQSLDLTLRFGAKGRLIDYLETLQLLGTKTSEDGYRNWNQDIEIGGSLADPDTSALKELFNNAARRALGKPEKAEVAETSMPPAGDGKTPPSQNKASEQAPFEGKEKSKEEALRDDIEMGL